MASPFLFFCLDLIPAMLCFWWGPFTMVTLALGGALQVLTPGLFLHPLQTLAAMAVVLVWILEYPTLCSYTLSIHLPTALSVLVCLVW